MTAIPLTHNYPRLMAHETYLLHQSKLPVNNSFNEGEQKPIKAHKQVLPEILFITSYPPRECGIATYSQDLIKAIEEKFGLNFSLKIAALNPKDTYYNYPKEVKYCLQSDEKEHFVQLANVINKDANIAMIFLQHEFGLFGGENGNHLLKLMAHLKRPIATTFHTVLPNPNPKIRKLVRKMTDYSNSVIVMTQTSAAILQSDYGIAQQKIEVIPHGTHLINTDATEKMEAKIHLSDRIVLSTFGLLSEGKSIETAIEALPMIIKEFPDVVYLIIGKTHPEVLKKEGEKYRDSLYQKVVERGLQNNVRFINRYVTLDELMAYLQRTTIYLFTSKDPNQAVSGTLAYALASGCPVISTPIPHAKEWLQGAGINVDFQNAEQLAQATIYLLKQPSILNEMRLNALHKINPSSWQNTAIAHVNLTKNSQIKRKTALKYELPPISLKHLKKLTTPNGMIQFAQIAEPDLNSGYTLDDNARALIALTKHYALTGDVDDLQQLTIYLNFVLFCQQNDGHFLNYVNQNGAFASKNNTENLEDANGRAIWALGYFCAHPHLFSPQQLNKAEKAIQKSLHHIQSFHSPRAISFAIKGLYYYTSKNNSTECKNTIVQLADNLVSKYRGVSHKKWKWFENYLTYANSVLPEALLMASLRSDSSLYRKIAKSAFDFLLTVIFQNQQIKVISNQGWYQKDETANRFGEQPIDVAYTILALDTFYQSFQEQHYLEKMEIAFNWFLGNNHLHQIIYNPVTGGCFDGLEKTHVNLNQGAESTVSYLLARLVFADIKNSNKTIQQAEKEREKV